MKRDHSIFQQTIININTGIGKKIGLEICGISYNRISDIEYIAATFTESIAKKKFVITNDTDNKSFSPFISWNENVTKFNESNNLEISIGHYPERKYKLKKINRGGVGDIVGVSPIAGEEAYPIVTDLDLHYINFGKVNDLQNTTMYQRLYCDGITGGSQMKSQLDNLLDQYWTTEWMTKINLFANQWLGWISPAEIIVMFYMNEFHQRLFENSSKKWQKILSSFPLISQGVTAGIDIKHYNELKIISDTLPLALRECLLWNSNSREDLSQFPGINDVTQVCIVTTEGSEIKTGKKAILEAYQDVPGEGTLLAPLHPYWLSN